MKVVINGEERELPAPMSVAELLTRLGLDQRFGAVELNREVVPRSQHAERALRDGDQVEIIRFVGGG